MQTDNPTELIDSLDPEAIRAALAEADRRRAALRVLLRAALARRRLEGRTHQPSARGEKGHA